MKRIIALALAVAVLCCVPTFAFAEVGYTTTVSIFDYDFETAQTGYDFCPTAVGVEFPTFPGPDGNEDNKVFLPSSSGDGRGDLGTGLGSYTGTLVYEADYYLGETISNHSLLGLRGSSALSVISLESNRSIKFYGNTVTLDDDSTLYLTDYAWYHFYAEFDFITMKAKFIVSGELDGEPFTATLEDVTMDVKTTYTTVVRNYRTAGKDYYIDNAKGFFKAKNFLMSAEGIDADGNGLGADGVIYDGGKIKVSFTETMSAETVIASNFTLTNSFGREIPVTGAFDATNNVFIITPSEDLAPRSEYSITASGLKTALGANADNDDAIVVKTIGAPFSIADVDDGSVSDGNVTYTVSVKNTNAESGYVVAVSYDGEKMNSVGLTAVTAEDDYEVTLASGGDRTVFYLMSNDGTFKLIDMLAE